MFQTRLGGNYFEQLNETYYPRTVSEGRATNGKAIVSNSTYTSILTENLLTYRHEIDKHRFDFLGGFSYEKSQSRYRTSESRDFPDDKLGFYRLQDGSQPRLPKPAPSNGSWPLSLAGPTTTMQINTCSPILSEQTVLPGWLKERNGIISILWPWPGV